jgi:rhamnosyltransferase
MNKICAVIVSYNSPENAISCINSALNQVEKIIVVDNSPDTRSRERFKNIHYPDKVSFAYNEVNKGLGCALNQGIQYSLTNNYRWTLLLDQDSALTENMVGEMLRSHNNLSNEAQKGVALIIPKVYDLNFGKILPPILTTTL